MAGHQDVSGRSETPGARCCRPPEQLGSSISPIAHCGEDTATSCGAEYRSASRVGLGSEFRLHDGGPRRTRGIALPTGRDWKFVRREEIGIADRFEQSGPLRFKSYRRFENPEKLQQLLRKLPTLRSDVIEWRGSPPRRLTLSIVEPGLDDFQAGNRVAPHLWRYWCELVVSNSEYSGTRVVFKVGGILYPARLALCILPRPVALNRHHLACRSVCSRYGD